MTKKIRNSNIQIQNDSFCLIGDAYIQNAIIPIIDLFD